MNKAIHQNTLVPLGMVGVTILSGAFLLSAKTHADDVVDPVNITVPVSCTMSGTGMDTHDAEIENGRYVPDIGTTTLHTFCNDAEGFAIYASGFTGNTVGNNVLTSATLGSTYDIITGTATSAGAEDVSNWAMKLAITQDSGDTTGTNAFVIDSDTEGSFGSYHTVPSEYTKVAHKASATDMTASTGGTKLTTTYAAYISKYQPAGTYSGQVKYVLVHPSDADAPTPFDGETLQSVSNWASMVAMGQTVTVPDARDNEEYTVARLADGRLWLTKNLRLDLNTYYDKITPENTNNPTQAFLDELAINHAPTNAGNWSIIDRDSSLPGGYKNIIRYNNQEIGDMTTDNRGHTYDEYGIYYNWYTATAGNGTYEIGYDSDPATGDLCPSGWHLPTVQRSSGDRTNSEYGALSVALGGRTNQYGAALDVYGEGFQPTGQEMSERFYAEPNNTTMAGYYYDGQLIHSLDTEYWSSNAKSAQNVFTFGIGGGYIRPGMYENHGYKYTGHAMRCIANRLSYPFTVKYAPGVISVSVDGVVVQDGQSIPLIEGSTHDIEIELAQEYTIDNWQASSGILVETDDTTSKYEMGFSPSTLTFSTTKHLKNPVTINYAPGVISVSVDGAVIQDGQSITLIEGKLYKIDVELATGYLVEAWQSTSGSFSDATTKSAYFKMGFAPSILTPVTVYYPAMQDVEEWGSNVSQGQTIEAIDVRDESVYTVARLADGKLWMTKNLRLNLAEANITEQNTNNPSPQFIDGLDDLNSAIDTAWCMYNNSACIDQIKYNSSNIGDSTVDSSGHTYDEYGIYYNWYTATAGNGLFSTDNYTTVSGDICPSGWRLPTGTYINSLPPWEWRGDYWELSTYLADLTPNEITGENFSLIISAENNSKVKLSPNNYLLSGVYSQNSREGLGELGMYWSSQSVGSGDAYSLIVQAQQSGGPLGNTSAQKYNGYSVRCLAK